MSEYPTRGYKPPEGVRVTKLPVVSRSNPPRGYKRRASVFGGQRCDLITRRVIGCTFFGSFLYASQETNIKKLKQYFTLKINLTLFITNLPA